MKIYVSTPSSIIPKAKETMARVVEMGHEISFDWTVGFEDEPSFSNVQLWERARNDLIGVQRAHLLLVVVTSPDGPSIGCAAEIGAASVTPIPIIMVEPEVINPSWDRHPFRHLASYRVKSIEKALSLLPTLGDLYGKG